METPDEFVKQKVGVKDMRNEIKGLKEKMFQNTAVMRADALRQYLDKLRYVENAISADNAMGGNEKKFLKQEHKELDKKQKKEHKEAETESESDSSDDEKPAKEKVKKEIKMIEKDIKAEKKHPEKVSKLHKDEMKHLKALEKELSTIPKPMHASYKKHLKAHDGDHEKARKALKKEMKL